jgi:putative ABC transport system permease protein
MRAPRRTALTALGIGATIVSLVAVLGALDSFNDALDRGSAELRRGARGRVTATLAGFEPEDAELVRSIEGAPAVGEVEPTVTLGGIVSSPAAELAVRLQALDLASDIWHPSVEEPAAAGGLPGVVLAGKAAEDLGVDPGDTVTVRHPFRTGESTFDARDTRMRVVGVHPNPMRFMAYVDRSDAAVFGLGGAANELQVVPAEGFSAGDVERALFRVPGVAAVQEPDEILTVSSDLLDRFAGFFRVVEAFALVLALVIAFNSSSISADERAREHATMAAYGVRPRTLLRMSVVESALVGLLGTLVGLGFGFVALRWLMGRVAGEIPEFDLPPSVTIETIAATLVLGVVVVGLAPLLTARKLRRMDVPSTLRVME